MHGAQTCNTHTHSRISIPLSLWQKFLPVYCRTPPNSKRFDSMIFQSLLLSYVILRTREGGRNRETKIGMRHFALQFEAMKACAHTQSTQSTHSTRTHRQPSRTIWNAINIEITRHRINLFMRSILFMMRPTERLFILSRDSYMNVNDNWAAAEWIWASILRIYRFNNATY